MVNKTNLLVVFMMICVCVFTTAMDVMSPPDPEPTPGDGIVWFPSIEEIAAMGTTENMSPAEIGPEPTPVGGIVWFPTWQEIAAIGATENMCPASPEQ